MVSMKIARLEVTAGLARAQRDSIAELAEESLQFALDIGCRKVLASV